MKEKNVETHPKDGGQAWKRKDGKRGDERHEMVKRLQNYMIENNITVNMLWLRSA